METGLSKLVASDLEDIFNEIYNDPEQFPIYLYTDSKTGKSYYQVEGFEYRYINGTTTLSVHSYGAAVDINSTYNQQYIVPAGSNYKIDPNGSVVRTITEHGWYWGGEFRPEHLDWMHFSLTERGANSRI